MGVYGWPKVSGVSIYLGKGACTDGRRCLMCLSICVRVCTDGLRCLMCLSSCVRVCADGLRCLMCLCVSVYLMAPALHTSQPVRLIIWYCFNISHFHMGGGGEDTYISMLLSFLSVWRCRWFTCVLVRRTEKEYTICGVTYTGIEKKISFISSDMEALLGWMRLKCSGREIFYN
jgi:hypothetical protein